MQPTIQRSQLEEMLNNFKIYSLAVTDLSYDLTPLAASIKHISY